MEHKFEIGQKVRHKANSDFDMVIIDFAVHWINNQYKMRQEEKNPEYPICEYYNIHTNQWDQMRFEAVALESVE